MTTRADYVLNRQKSQIYFSDIPTNFDMSPNSGDLARVTNEDAVAQSLENLVVTFLKERVYSETIGCAVQFRAFELSSSIEVQFIKNAVINCVNQNEPRVSVQDVEVGLYPDNNAFNVNIYYYVINNTVLQKLPVIIKVER
jgi:phage baseplate assembly protein W